MIQILVGLADYFKVKDEVGQQLDPERESIIAERTIARNVKGALAGLKPRGGGSEEQRCVQSQGPDGMSKNHSGVILGDPDRARSHERSFGTERAAERPPAVAVCCSCEQQGAIGTAC